MQHTKPIVDLYVSSDYCSYVMSLIQLNFIFYTGDVIGHPWPPLVIKSKGGSSSHSPFTGKLCISLQFQSRCSKALSRSNMAVILFYFCREDGTLISNVYSVGGVLCRLAGVPGGVLI